MTETGNGWYALLDIIASNAEYARQARSRRPVSCPNDGTPLEESQDGTLHCRHDGWQYPRDWSEGMAGGL